MSNNFNALEPEQQQAFESAIRPKKPTTIIAGYAGTGKTTVMAAMAKELGIDDCVVMSPTNKAATVLRKKGIRQAKTIHSVLYSPHQEEVYKRDAQGEIMYHQNPDGSFLLDELEDKVPIVIGTELSFSLREADERSPKIALVDEASMINEDIRNDLASVFEHVVFFGDPAQLPPVNGKDIFAQEQPDVFLKQVHRQAADNPIIRYATSIRNGEELDIKAISDGLRLFHTHAGNSKIIPTLVQKNVQAICWTNRMRHDINADIRREKGYKHNRLEAGEDIVCLQNVRIDDDRGRQQLKLYNGQLLRAIEGYDEGRDHFDSKVIQVEDPETTELYHQRVWPFWNENYFQLKDNYQNWRAELDRIRNAKKRPITFGIDCDFAYCLTAHKAQGSEFDSVAIWDQRSIMKSDRDRWYYTAVTRAKEKLLIIR